MFILLLVLTYLIRGLPVKILLLLSPSWCREKFVLTLTQLISGGHFLILMPCIIYLGGGNTPGLSLSTGCQQNSPAGLADEHMATHPHVNEISEPKPLVIRSNTLQWFCKLYSSWINRCSYFRYKPIKLLVDTSQLLHRQTNKPFYKNKWNEQNNFSKQQSQEKHFCPRRLHKTTLFLLLMTWRAAFLIREAPWVKNPTRSGTWPNKQIKK